MTHNTRSSRLSQRLASHLGRLLLVGSLAAGIGAAQAQQLTPAQIAYVKAETRKADEAYVKDVAEIVGTRSSTVAKIMPEHGRITDPVARLIAGLEQRLGKPLTDDQKTAIQAASLQRQKHVDWAGQNARNR
ncbi:hypothetical protein VVD49_17840 [Uliginosibacterium sp. H3]|uniref:LTXXQ motif family protein n=1 Tax=Uliginosibacterium silvisoli TaxID=3114758 RepID=A0ABU6K7N1_9RHOO|nr:hypothetical protein [Uliginosibacterium sp. H3]